MTEPHPPDATWPRYSAKPFPSYRFLPGKNPHPRRDPRGHSYSRPDPQPAAFSLDAWQQSEDYLYGIDLYNYAYWWESHEVFEGLWHVAGHNTEQGNFFQALIQLAAANLKYFLGNPAAAHNLFQKGIIRLQHVPPSYMGIDVPRLTDALQAHLINPHPHTPLIGLSPTAREAGSGAIGT